MSHQKHVIVIVMGDLGRSPRMNYHALSLLEHGHRVTLIGYEGEDIMPQLKLHGTLLDVIRFSPYKPPSILRRIKILLPFYYLLRALGLFNSLCSALRNIEMQSDCLLVQNPPSLPLLMVSYLFCNIHERVTSVRPGLVIDWHNLGFSMFEGKPAFISRLAAEYERTMAPLADGNLTVTKAMKEFLVDSFGVQREKICEVYDRPPEFFRPTKVDVMHDLMKRLKPEMENQCPHLIIPEQNRTQFTEVALKRGKRTFVERKDRPALIVSSTSWTPDEDFRILLDAITIVDRLATETPENYKDLPPIMLIVTGKGPEKEMYQKKIANLNLSNRVSVLTLWLETTDYPKLLGCADLGISLHTSTSGLDLPMKVLDMFGCEVPVCAVGFSCLDELVKDKENGVVFKNSADLAEALISLLSKERDESGKITGDLALYRKNIKDMTRWRENWKTQAHDMIMSACPAISQVNPSDNTVIDNDKKER
jgi:beta-1,4-mannosyltransferase